MKNNRIRKVSVAIILFFLASLTVIYLERDYLLPRSETLRAIRVTYLHYIKDIPKSLHLERPTNHPFWLNESQISKQILQNRTICVEDITIKIHTWSNNYKAGFNLNFDDFCPKTEENNDFDFGGDPNRGINKTFIELLKKYPYLKVTLFLIPNCGFIGNGRSNESYDDMFLISKSEYNSWVSWIHRSLLDSGQIEIADHGYSHFQSDVKDRLQCVEYEYASEEKIIESLNKALNIFDNVNIPIHGMRPPGWGMGQDLALIGALKKLKFEYCASSSLNDGLNYGEKRVSNIYPMFHQGILNLPQNMGIDEILTHTSSLADEIISKEGLISLKGHYTDNPRLGNEISGENIGRNTALLDYLNRKYANEIWYATMQKIADFWIAKDRLEIQVNKGHATVRVSLYNKSTYDLNRLVFDFTNNKYILVKENTEYFFKYRDNKMICDIPANVKIDFVFRKQ